MPRNSQSLRTFAAAVLVAAAIGIPLSARARFGPGLALSSQLAPERSPLGRAECRTAPSKILGRAVPYCIILPPGYDSSRQRYPILYFLHGLGENEQMLINSGGMNLIEDLWEERKIAPFLVVTPAADRSFYVNSRDGRVRYEDFFMREFLSFIERRYRVLPGRRFRGISGVSMGGYGALRFALKYPRDFGAVSAHSAALVPEGPGATLQPAVAQQITRFMGTAFGSPFDPAYWRRESPFTIVREQRRLAGPKIYFDCGSEDDYGFDRGAKAFDALLTARGIPHEFHLYPGGHDWSYFAAHLPASLAFHSRVFAGGR